jgi:hypothetical protein
MHGRVRAWSRSTAQQTATTAVGLQLGSDDGFDGTIGFDGEHSCASTTWRDPFATASVVWSRLADGASARRCKSRAARGRRIRRAIASLRHPPDLRPGAIVPPWSSARSECAGWDHAAIAGAVIASRRVAPRSEPPRRQPTATPTTGRASRDGVGLLTPALPLSQEHGRQARANRALRSGRISAIRMTSIFPLAGLAVA